MITKKMLENKLKLWDIQGFSQFLEDLAAYKTDKSLLQFADVLKKLYKAKLEEINDKENKFKQTKLKL